MLHARIIQCFNGSGCVAIQHTKHKPMMIWLRHKVRGDPCVGVLSLCALNFGGDAGGKSGVRGFFPASTGVHIRQCVHLVHIISHTH